MVRNEASATEAAKAENSLEELWPLRVERRERLFVLRLEHREELLVHVVDEVGT